jgi:pSer/pThr/pTyr-binding forkhead associated (FHA) protein
MIDFVAELHLYKQSCYLFGRTHNVADIPIDHPSCSGQHAVLQYRESFHKDLQTGEVVPEVKPYLMDLDSTNGTYLNGGRLDSARYYELKDKDLIRFANSTRDYIVMKGKPIGRHPTAE